MEDVGREVRRLREERGWSQAKLAAAADMAVSGISQIETGVRSPSAATLTKLARALGLEVADLFPKAQAPRPKLPGEVYDPRASELRRENYLSALLVFATRQHMAWEKELNERLSAPAHEFFGWAGGVCKTVHLFSDTLFNGDVFSYGLGTLSSAEEDLRSVLLRKMGQMLQLTKLLLNEWNRHIAEMKDAAAAEEQRLELEKYNEEFQRIVAANFSEVSEHLVGS